MTRRQMFSLGFGAVAGLLLGRELGKRQEERINFKNPTMGDAITLVVDPRLTDPTDWFLYNTETKQYLFVHSSEFHNWSMNEKLAHLQPG
jgi:hypothetical protein